MSIVTWNSPRTQLGVGGCQLSWKKALRRCTVKRYKRYEGVGRGSNYQEKKRYVTLECPHTTRSNAPRLDNSLKKNTTTLKFDLYLPVGTRGILGDGIRKKNIFQPEVFFFEFTNL